MDITERKRAEEALKKSEERLRQAAQAGRMFAFEWDPVTDEVIRSEEAGPILGLEGSAATHGTGQGFFAKILAEDREKVIQRLQQLTPETDRYTANYRIVRSDTGEIIWLEEIAMAAFEGGRLRRLYGMMMDITERKRAEEALRQRSAQLAEAVAALEGKNAEMERFTYTISHDLKSPLVTISTFLSYLEEDLRRGDTGRITQDMQYMRTATDKMSQMLGELLELSRLGRIANPPKEISFQELVQEALQAVAGAVAARGVEVWVTEKDVMLLGDRHRLGAIWQNLLENAVKYMGGQPRPRLEIGLEEPGEEVVFFVRDNGIGIESGYQEKIFNLFEKLDSQSGGTGIGLAVAKRIVELYRGKIWVESGGTDQGACFRFTLPGALIARGEGSGSGEGNRYDT
jgi:PAS domain S-box-containing protein